MVMRSRKSRKKGNEEPSIKEEGESGAVNQGRRVMRSRKSRKKGNQ